MWFACVHYCATETVLPGYVPVCLCTHLCVCMFECVCVCAWMGVCGRQAVSSGGGPVCQCGGGRGEQG